MEPHKTMEAFKQAETLSRLEVILDQFLDMGPSKERTEVFDTLQALLEFVGQAEHVKCCITCEYQCAKDNIKLCEVESPVMYVIPAPVLYKGCPKWREKEVLKNGN